MGGAEDGARRFDGDAVVVVGVQDFDEGAAVGDQGVLVLSMVGT